MELVGYANRLNLPRKLLTYLEKIRSRLYTDWYLRKKDGSKREISVYVCDSHIASQLDEKLVEYSKALKLVHRRIKDLLDETIDLPDCVFGFKKGCSAKTAASKHVGKKYIFSVDIKDFFPSITSDMVQQALMNEGVEQNDVWLIARLVAYKGRLPQGAITSPTVSNVVFKPKDLQILKLCERYGLTYTRYADDLTFSTNEEIDWTQFTTELEQILQPEYRINTKKLKIYGPKQAHYVLGLIVNRKVNTPKNYRRTLRAAVYNYLNGKIPYGVDPVKYKATLKAKLGYALYVNKIPSLEKLYKRLRRFDPNKVQEWQHIVV